MRFTTILFLLLTTLPAHAFYTFQDTGDLLQPQQMRWATELQFITSNDDGINFIGRYDQGYTEEANIRLEAGFGTTDYVFGAFMKWVPYPDFEKQPAIGFTVGAHIAGYEGETEIALRFIPFVSKEFDTDVGLLTPYAALPIAFSNYDEETNSPVQLALGTVFRHADFNDCDFTGELGFDLSDSFTYISVGVIFPAFE